jgi:hypothetical protein
MLIIYLISSPPSPASTPHTINAPVIMEFCSDLDDENDSSTEVVVKKETSTSKVTASVSISEAAGANKGELPQRRFRQPRLLSLSSDGLNNNRHRDTHKHRRPSTKSNKEKTNRTRVRARGNCNQPQIIAHQPPQTQTLNLPTQITHLPSTLPLDSFYSCSGLFSVFFFS